MGKKLCNLNSPFSILHSQLLKVLVAIMVALSMPTASADFNVDWERGVITASGVGSPADFAKTVAESRATARESAETVALGKLAGIVNSIQVDSDTTVKDLRLKAASIGARPANGPEVVSVNYTEGTCHITIQIPIFGENSIASSLLPRKDGIEPFATPDVSIVAAGNYTGVIIDCRDLNLNPVMLPVIKSEDNIDAYSHINIDYDTMVAKGIVDYALDMNQTSRAGSNPLINLGRLVCEITM